MILNTGSRTDIPAFYSEWFMNRVREGFVLVRNPYYPKQIYRYRLTPDVVDVLSFCTKNPGPMLEHLEELKRFRQLWYVTLTPYAKDIEPGVPDKHEVIRSFQKLSETIGSDAVIWRYDPVFLSERYTMEYHQRAFQKICSELQGYTKRVVVSFIDLYQKTVKNFPEVREVSKTDQEILTEYFVKTAAAHGMQVYLCLEDKALERFGAIASGCMTQEVIEDALHIHLDVPRSQMNAREGCSCLLGSDIGMYNTCAHFCRYCYANYDRESVIRNMRMHDPASPLLCGTVQKDDIITEAKQVSYLDGQMRLDFTEE